MKSATKTLIVSLVLLLVLSTIPLVAQGESQVSKHQIRYAVKALNTLGGTQSGANGVTDDGWVTGWATFPGDQSEHGVLWRGQTTIDLGTLGGPNSAVSFPVTDDTGIIAGNSQISEIDPFNENFCTFSFDTTYLCQGFRWQDGQMTALPTLGGNNSWATVVNHKGEIAGFAETSTKDPNCVPPQVFDVEAVVWGPKQGKIREFSPLPGDAVSAALSINDRGQVVGGSGTCGTPSPAVLVHALLWENNSVTDLGSLGGVMNNMAVFINNHEEVVGISDLPGDTTFHAFLWTRDHRMRDLGTLPGDVLSFPNSINDQGVIAGQSCDQNGNCRAVLWERAGIIDLNTLVFPGSSLYLLDANDINNAGEIAGYAYDPSTGDTPGFLAIPCDDKHADMDVCADADQEASTEQPRITLPDKVRRSVRPYLLRSFGFLPMRP